MVLPLAKHTDFLLQLFSKQYDLATIYIAFMWSSAGDPKMTKDG
jgi:hypothetical protein